MSRVRPCDRRTCECGFALLGCLLLLGIVSILGVTVMASAVGELRLASNVVHRDRAFQAAEFAIGQALASPDLDTTPTPQAPRRMPASPDATLPIAAGNGDSYRYLLYFVEATPLAGESTASVMAYHFVAETSGFSARGATDTHVQGFYVVRPAGWTGDVPEPSCDASMPGCDAAPHIGPVRTYWRQAEAE